MGVEKIDKNITPLVCALNKTGISTTGSCAGHASRLSPAPWVKITGKSETKNREMRKMVNALLTDFYRDRKVRSDIRIVIDDGNFGFWIHNGGASYARWRRAVERSAERIQEGKKGVRYLIETEKRKKNIRLYQREIEAFTNFLKSARDQHAPNSNKKRK